MIKGSAINNDGSGKMTFTAPGLDGQANVIARAHRMAGVRSRDIGYVEAHGTGTPVGDPIEIAALVAAFEPPAPSAAGYCALGTVKSQIGHLGPAAGMAGLIKAAMVVERAVIPACINFAQINPQIELQGSALRIPRTAAAWNRPRLAGVSAFGVGGTNVHLVLGAAPEGSALPVAAAANGQHGMQERPEAIPFVVSGRSAGSVRAACTELSAYLRAHPALRPGDVASVLATGRRQLKHRIAVAAATTADAACALAQAARSGQAEAADPSLPLVFAFPGQGAQFVNAGRGLYDGDRAYREAVDECSAFFGEMDGLDLTSLLYPSCGEGRASELVREARWAQPITFTLEYALGRALLARGIRPDIMIGHSVGEYAAACLAGVFDLRNAMTLVAARGRLMQGTNAGAMTAVALSESEVRGVLPDMLDIAALNAPNQTVVSGEIQHIAQFEEWLTAAGVLNTRIGTRHAAHSRLMDPILVEFAAIATSVTLKPPGMRLFSSLTGSWVSEDMMTDPGYWVRHVRMPVRFLDAASAVLAESVPFVIECGPGRALARAFGAISKDNEVPAFTPWVRDMPEPLTGAALVARLWAQGVAPAWDQVLPAPARRVSLPGYPFERHSYWVDPPAGGMMAAAPVPAPRAKPTDSWLQEPRWSPASLPARGAVAPDPATLLVLTGPGEDQLAAALRDTGHPVVHLRWDEPGLREKLTATGEGIGTLVYVAPHDPAWQTTSAAERTRNLLVHGFRQLLTTVTTVLAARQERGLDICVVSRGRFAIAAEEPVRPELALLAGPCRVLPQEYPAVRLVEMDADMAAYPLAGLISSEIAHAEWGSVVHYRDGERYTLSYGTVPGGPAERPWEVGGRYLITGGLGGIGLALAEEASLTPGVRLVLTHRAPLPAPKDWAAAMASAETAPALRRRLTALLRLRNLGADARTVQADVTEREAMRELAARHGPFHGIVHAAGVPGGRLVSALDDDHVAAVLAPKVQGALLIDELLATEETAWVVLCSSMSSVVGGVGHADYASANAFLDAFAQWRCAQGRRTISLAFDMWTEFGMAVDEAARSSRERTHSLTHPLFHEARETPDAVEFAGTLDPRTDWVVDEHRVAGHPVLPGTGILEYLRAAAQLRLDGAAQIDLVEVDLTRPLAVAESNPTEVLVRIQDTRDGLRATLSSRIGDDVTVHATAGVRPGEALRADREPARGEPGGIHTDGAEPAQPATSPALTFGLRWACPVRSVRTGREQLVVDCRLRPEFSGDLTDYWLHPALLDVAAGAFLPVLTGETYLPLSYERVSVIGRMTEEAHSTITLRSAPDAPTMRFDVSVSDAGGCPVLEILGYSLRRVTADEAERAASSRIPRNKRLVIGEAGDLETLCFTTGPMMEPGPGQVQIRVLATGLNFKEVLLASGLLPLDPGYAFGLECAGVVSAVGPGVLRHRVGDPVMAIGSSCFADYAIVGADMVHPIPAGISYAEAASVPVAFTTAYDTLVTTANLQRGERVLIHAASGGVGLAAIQVALHRGAEVFGTAGNPTKRDFARAAGATLVMDSRSLEFEAQTVEAGGVDVVLNSLAGDFIAAGLRTLHPRGRFIEIGRRDIAAGTNVDLGLFADGQAFTAYNPQIDGGTFESAWKSVAGLLSAGAFTCLPVRVFDIGEVSEAFTFMARAHHIGKVVVARPGAEDTATPAAAGSAVSGGAGPTGISTSVGLESFRRALTSGLPALLVSRRSVSMGSDEMVVAAHVLTGPESAADALRTGMSLRPPGDLRTGAERALARTWAELLQVDGIGRDDRFVDLGGDSLYATQMVARIRRDFGVRLAPADVLGDLPLSALAARIEDLAGDLEADS